MKKIRTSEGVGENPPLTKWIRIMKLTCLLLAFALVQVSAETYSQTKKLTLNLKDAPLAVLFEEIEKTSEFNFFYDSSGLDLSQKVTVTVEDSNIEAVLDMLFTDSDISYEIFDRYIILKSKKWENIRERFFAQQQQQPAVSGTVTDESGEPLPGVTVVVKGTTQGTVTNADGNYSLSNIPEDATLQFSFVGMRTQEVEVGEQTSIDVSMEEEAIGIEEVVAIGYGTMKKSDLTGSVVAADIAAFEESPNISISQSLHGAVAGLNIGQVSSSGEDPSILIRGQNSFNRSNTAPLVVLDGVIYEGNIVDINPSDIESVDILKDASSAAIYGSRSSNGVIIITTKKGEDFGKPVFTYSGSYTIQTPSSAPKLMNREQYLQRVKDVLWDNAYLAPDYTEPNPNFDPTAYWTRYKIEEGYKLGTEFDWWDAATQTGHINEHNLSMRGKNQLTSYYISTGYTDQLGYIMNDEYQRYTVRMNVENKILDWITLGVQSFIASGDYSGREPHMGNLLAESPISGPFDEEGNYLKNPSDLPARNPFFDSEADDFDKRLNIFGNFYADIQIPFVEGLSYRLNYSQNYQTNRHFYFNEYDNNFTGASYKNNSTRYKWVFDNILNYQKDIDKHNIKITLVAGREEGEYETTLAEAKEFAKTDLSYNKLNIGGVPLVNSGAWDESSLYYMGRLHYGYNKKYLSTFTIRRDGFSGFSSLNKFGVFPSGALAWVVSEEEFLNRIQGFINFLKFRVSYGKTGNRTLGRYGTLSRVEAYPGYVFGDGSSPYIVQRVQNLGNAGLSWETTTSFNLGVDFSFWDQRIRGNIDYYNSNTKDILYEISIPEITGFNSISDNIGKVHNNGIELSITGTVVKQQEFSWDMTLNYWRNRNEIVSILGLDLDNDGIEDDLVADGLFIGEPLGVVYNFVAEGLYQIGDEDLPNGFYPGQYRFKDLNNDGDITADFDRKIMGYTDPAYRFSINNHFRYKNLTLRVFINSAQGGKNWYYGVNNPNQNFGDNAFHNNSFIWDWWTPSNPDSKYPQLYHQTPIAKSYLHYDQRSFVRLQDVSLSYKFNTNFINKMGIQNLKIYVSGKNLITWTDWQGWDPETGQGLVRGSDPVLTGYTFGLDFSF